jgi:transketolase
MISLEDFMYQKITDVKELGKKAHDLRVKVMKILCKFGYGHVGGSLSLVELVTVLYFNEMNIDPKNPNWEDRDRFIMSKGHGCFTQYAVLTELGIIPEKELSRPYEIDSMIQAHPELGFTPGIEMSTGALGQGLSAGIGMALGARLRKKVFRIYVIMGDGELHEGQVWEAAMMASKYQLDNLVAFVDYNSFALSGSIQDVMPLEPLQDKWKAFGWNVLQINGHSIPQIVNSLQKARDNNNKPTIILAKTVKAKGVSFLENRWNSHATPLSPEDAMRALQELGCCQDEINTIL